MMNTLLANKCCCTMCVTNHNAFKVSFRYRSTYQLLVDYDNRSQSIAGDGPYGPCTGTIPPPACDDPTHDCSVPSIGSSSASFAFYGPTICVAGGYKADYKSNFDINVVNLVVPYVNTTTEAETYGSSCSWVYNFNGTLTESGLGYSSEKLIDNNSVNWSYDRILTGCQTSCIMQAGSSKSFTIKVSYGHRSKYTAGPTYMSVSRPAQHPEFNNWTWEITGGVFIVRNAGGFVQSSYDLHGKTLQQAAVAIDAFASVVVQYAPGIPASSFPATLMEDKPKTSLKLAGGGYPDSDPIFLLDLVGKEVEIYQSGLNSPFWAIGYEDNPTRYYCNAGCLNLTSEYSYTEGIDRNAEQLFCAGIATRRRPSAQNITSAPNPGLTIDFLSPLLNYPLLDQDSPICNRAIGQNCDVLPDNGSIWYFPVESSFPAFGDRATLLSYSGHQLTSDDDGSTECTYSHGIDTDYCDCDPCPGSVCYKQYRKYAWNTSEFFKVVRV